MAFLYQSESIVESFQIEALITEGIEIYVYGASWNGSQWLDDPTVALAAVNDAFDSVPDLAFSSIQIISSLTSAGVGMAFAVVNPIYKNKTYLELNEIGDLRANIRIALDTGETGLHLNYGDIVLGTSKLAS